MKSSSPFAKVVVEVAVTEMLAVMVMRAVVVAVVLTIGKRMIEISYAINFIEAPIRSGAFVNIPKRK